jgi:hypothetical protein
LSLFSSKIILTVENNGLSADYGNKVNIVYPGNEIKKSESMVILPYSVNKSEINLKHGILALNSPANIRVKTRDSELIIPTKKGEVILNQLLVFCLVFLIVLISFQLKNKLKR